MKNQIKASVVAVMIAALPLVGMAVHTMNERVSQRKALIQFVDYCKGCENLRQVNPAKDITKASLHDLKSMARFYESQDNFADCTDYPQQAEINYIIGRSYSARIINK